MDVISHVIDVIGRGEAVKANGPIEHWLTTLATGFWGFDDSKEGVWSGLQEGDVLIFQSGPPNWDFVDKYKPKPNVSGFIGAGVVSHTSKKDGPRWLSEVIESNVHGALTPKLWPNLVHFSDVIWLGNVDLIPAQELQARIEECKSQTLDLKSHIEHLAENILSFGAMVSAGFTCAPMGTGGRLIKRAEVLARLFQSYCSVSTHRAYADSTVVAPVDFGVAELPGSYDFKCLGNVTPSKRSARPSQATVPRKGSIRKKDYLQEAADNQELGLLGELIVFAAEQSRVLNEFGEGYVSRVIHVSKEEGDGAGYDIRTLRRGLSGVTEHYLEVKTTSGNANTAFFISENELRFATSEPDRYEVVRLHSLDRDAGEYFEYRLTARELLGMDMAPVSYRVNVGAEVASDLD
ncbi:protein of unknown function [Pseudomonas peli]|uniref:Protein NO VEIN C-terminal domain-containing protein n=1 Tax=Pseudomonas peli TaxID=592361 RepID=A0AB37ZEE3_9PSED|nr:DUF3883 domain-containing protein [Pseudomonas peli]NMZ70981.1 DUF3883 domain-containing protein [Pseudomonas peli]SCW81826.1 protein of unknown function [Pseudomonas peli]